MIAASEILSSWERCMESAPKAPLVADGLSGEWMNRSDIQAGRYELEAKLEKSLKRGTLVLMQRHNGPGWLAAALAVWSLGGVLVPVDPSIKESERERLIEVFRPTVGIFGEKIMVFDHGRLFRRPVVLGKLTSGSTGAPKALFFTASEMVADARQVEAGMGIGDDDVNLAVIPFGHSYGLGNLVFPALLKGRRIVCASQIFPTVLAEEAARSGVTVFPATPPLLKSLLRSDLSDDSWSGLRLVISAGARLDPGLATAFKERFGRTVHNFYGSSETGGIAFDADGEIGRRGDAVGRLLPGVNCVTTPSGRLLVSSAAVHSYGNKRVLSDHHAVLLADCGECREGGKVVLKGRTEQLLKLGARRINRREIEGSLRVLRGVDDCRVEICEDERGEILGAVIAGSISSSEIRIEAKKSLAAWKVPKRIRVVNELPTTERGKLNRAAISALLANPR